MEHPSKNCPLTHPSPPGGGEDQGEGGRRNASAASSLQASIVVIIAFAMLLALPVRAAYVDLVWDPPITKVDGTPLNDLAGYRVYFGPTGPACGGASFRDVPAASPTPSLGEVVIFRLDGLEAGTAYSVQVSALNQGGLESECSNEVTAAAREGGSAGAGGGGGGCFLATAAYGSAMAPQVVLLRTFRDRYLQATLAGRACVRWYYRVSPGLADRIHGSEHLRRLTRGILWPVLGLIWLLLHPWLPVGGMMGATGAAGWLWLRRKWRL
jgi:hypothetical protein